MYQYTARLLYPNDIEKSIYDADTIKIVVDLGFGFTFKLGPCRLYGINAPEMKGASRDAGVIARDYVRQKLTGVNSFIINSYKDDKDKYGRYLIDVILPDGSNLNQDLLRLGLAKPY